MATEIVTELLENNLLQQLAEAPTTGALAEARIWREAATRHSQGSYQALFEAFGDAPPSLLIRLQVAAEVAHLNGNPLLAKHYAAQLAARPSLSVEASSTKAAALNYAARVTLQPASATPAHLRALLDAGWSVPAVITLAQIVAYVNFESRVLTGLRLLAGHGAPSTEETAVVAGFWNRSSTTHSGRNSPIVFTQEELGWEPWLPPRQAADLSAQERQLLESFGQLDSDYFRLLAYNLPVLVQRTLTDRGIFFTPEGLPRGERELAAAVTSKVNGCIFCASVHARKASQLSKRNNDVELLLAVAPGEDLASGLEPRWRALTDFAARLAATPARVTPASFERLCELDFDTLDLLDLIQSVAFFSWANRLMLTLGEPFRQQITKP
jgi:alkylhydroperoxidase domain protein/CMD domain protein